MSAYAISTTHSERRRGVLPVSQSLVQRLRRAWRMWLPLTLALTLAALGAIALGATAWEYVSGGAGVDAGATEHAQHQVSPALTDAPTVRAITESLTRSTRGAAGQTLDVVFAPAGYLHRTGQHDAAARYDAERYLLFFVTEEVHAGELPAPARPVLLAGGKALLS